MSRPNPLQGRPPKRCGRDGADPLGPPQEAGDAAAEPARHAHGEALARVRRPAVALASDPAPRSARARMWARPTAALLNVRAENFSNVARLKGGTRQSASAYNAAWVSRRKCQTPTARGPFAWPSWQQVRMPSCRAASVSFFSVHLCEIVCSGVGCFRSRSPPLPYPYCAHPTSPLETDPLFLYGSYFFLYSVLRARAYEYVFQCFTPASHTVAPSWLRNESCPGRCAEALKKRLGDLCLWSCTHDQSRQVH